ncbi:PIR Superfamily Protein [Plasmodium ovale curtisi]|uniref:PIR Superfamily Protein n=1 Tax=Plasmodium ovale curtisi TaxID=864141 RepID=A0A1A8X4T4_PLAOA|nr:PIR Superfamily Protein [Plasmodium ovale curtisi]SBS98773.1 PIR Superfamily Protein [Plasmodium ovale curtisi]
MSLISEENVLDELELSLKDLTAYVIYDEFNIEREETDYNKYFKNVLELEDRPYYVDRMCNNLAGNLMKVSEKIKRGENVDVHCKYLNFWLYDNIKKQNIVHGKTSREDVIYAFVEGWRDMNEKLLKNKCRSRYDGNTSLEVLKHYKYLHDYFKNYSYIINNYKKNKDTCLLYNRYVNHVKPFYERYKGECCPETNSACYFFFDFQCNGMYNPDYVLNQMKCDHLLQQETSTMAQSESSGGDILESQDQKSRRNPDESGTESLNNSFPYTALSVVSPLIITSLMFYFFYKFTPMGSILHKKILKKTKHNYEDEDEDTQESAEKYLITNEMNSEKESYITYHPL